MEESRRAIQITLDRDDCWRLDLWRGPDGMYWDDRKHFDADTRAGSLSDAFDSEADDYAPTYTWRV